jgi:probable phosphoglycerate mutase
VSGQHTGRTDVPLTATGEQQAGSLRERLAGWRFAAVLSSPLVRARRTAELAGFAPTLDDDLLEWDNGRLEGRTTPEIRAELGPQWSLYTDGAPGGEAWQQVQRRCERVVERARAIDGDVLLVGHGHALCALAAVWVGLTARDGGALQLDPATLSVLGTHHDRPTVLRWNA